eukprot:692929-Prymnesium_polylepis.1
MANACLPHSTISPPTRGAPLLLLLYTIALRPAAAFSPPPLVRRAQWRPGQLERAAPPDLDSAEGAAPPPRLRLRRRSSPLSASAPAADGPGWLLTGTPLTALLVALWYAISVVNNQTSKLLVGTLGPELLTLNQLVLSVGCGAVVLAAQGSRPTGGRLGFASRAQL